MEKSAARRNDRSPDAKPAALVRYAYTRTRVLSIVSLRNALSAWYAETDDFMRNV